MLWWDWTARQRLALLAAVLVVALTPWLLLGLLPNGSYNAGVVAGGTALLAIPQMVAWSLFVGLKTGRMPVRFDGEDRIKSPTWFWTFAVIHVALLILFVWFFLAVVFDLPKLLP